MKPKGNRSRSSKQPASEQPVPEHAALPDGQPLARRKLIAIGVALSLLFIAFAVPAWNPKSERDPLTDHFTDHLRYRYCSSLVIKSPIKAATTPLKELARQDHARFPVTTWDEHPCETAPLHVLVHAPYQWVLEWGWLQPKQTTELYVTMLLVVSCLSLFLVFGSTNWWAGFFFAPALLRCSLNGLQEAIPILLCLLGFGFYVKGRRLAAVGLVGLAVAAYSRYVIWLPPIAWLCLRDRKELFAEFRGAWSRPVGRALVVGSAVLASWTFFMMYLVSAHRPLPAWTDPGPVAWIVLIAYGVLWLAYFLYRWRGETAPFMLIMVAFFCLYRGQLTYWYPLSALPLIVFARTGFEKAMWGLWLTVVSPLFLGFYPLDSMDLLEFVARPFR